ncbi:DUF596 domain-containing protein [Pseudomonas sp. PDM18]|nr:DUF596 domain-containing protein [Pseudomonas sp. PDM18]MBD9679978.1 DUF596 domain-containing protein [Pseudomonas sp. PDM18]
MTMSITDDEYKSVLEWSYGLSIDALWLSVCSMLEGATFTERKEGFLEVLSRVLSEGRARLACGVFLEGEISDQIKSFELAWPDAADMNEDLFWIRKDGVSWIPGGLVWIYDDGSEIWT